jgi:hypothetical protein
LQPVTGMYEQKLALVQEFEHPPDPIGINSDYLFNIKQDHLPIELAHGGVEVVRLLAKHDIAAAASHRTGKAWISRSQVA